VDFEDFEDFGSASAAGGTDLERFVRDLALCLSVHRDKSPALVWPDGIDAVVARTVRPRGRRHADAGPAGPDADRDEADELTSALGKMLGSEVTGWFVELPLGARRGGNVAETDLVLMPVHGSCGGRVEASAPGADGAVLEHALELRLRVGEALYVPRGFVYTLYDVHTPCTLQVLAVHPPVF
jgi:hypothetical protein